MTCESVVLRSTHMRRAHTAHIRLSYRSTFHELIDSSVIYCTLPPRSDKWTQVDTSSGTAFTATAFPIPAFVAIIATTAWCSPLCIPTSTPTSSFVWDVRFPPPRATGPHTAITAVNTTNSYV